ATTSSSCSSTHVLGVKGSARPVVSSTCTRGTPHASTRATSSSPSPAECSTGGAGRPGDARRARADLPASSQLSPPAYAGPELTRKDPADDHTDPQRDGIAPS